MLNLRWSSQVNKGFPGGSVVKNLRANAEMWHWTLDQEDPLEKEMAISIQYSLWENAMDRGAWHAPLRGCHRDSETTEQLSMHSEANADIKAYRLSVMFYLHFRNWKSSKASFTYYCHRLPIFFFFWTVVLVFNFSSCFFTNSVASYLPSKDLRQLCTNIYLTWTCFRREQTLSVCIWNPKGAAFALGHTYK